MLQVWQINVRYVDGIFPLKAEQNSIETSLCGRVFTLPPTWLGRFLGSELQLIFAPRDRRVCMEGFSSVKAMCSALFCGVCRVALVRVHFKVAAHCGLH